jgi:hypothetical protein
MNSSNDASKRQSKRQRKGNASSKSKHQTGSVTTSRLHFDRMENLMTVLSGRKSFALYPPTQSDQLHAGGGCISASLTAAVTRNTAASNSASTGASAGKGSTYIESIVFSRDKSNINYQVNNHHTYAPVNIKHPDYFAHPRLQQARGFTCVVEAGDTLYLPAHWWHEVTSTSDQDGKCLGVNQFFEPVYVRPMYNTTLPYFQTSRYYGHLHLHGQEGGVQRAVACTNDQVCFTEQQQQDNDEDKDSVGLMNKQNSIEGNNKMVGKRKGKRRAVLLSEGGRGFSSISGRGGSKVITEEKKGKGKWRGKVLRRRSGTKTVPDL